MGGRPVRFWGTAAIASLTVAAAVAWAGPVVLRLDPRPGLRPLTSGEFWLLTVFTLGVLAVLLGVAVALGGWFRASLLREALEQKGSPSEGGPSEGEPDQAKEAEEEGQGVDPAWWTAAVGAHLLVIYWAGWWFLG